MDNNKSIIECVEIVLSLHYPKIWSFCMHCVFSANGKVHAHRAPNFFRLDSITTAKKWLNFKIFLPFTFFSNAPEFEFFKLYTIYSMELSTFTHSFCRSFNSNQTISLNSKSFCSVVVHLYALFLLFVLYVVGRISIWFHSLKSDNSTQTCTTLITNME